MSIIEDLMQGVGKEVGRIQARSQEMLKAYNLNQEIRELEQAKAAKLIEIGRLIYDKYERQINITEEQLKTKITEIVSLEKDINHLQAQLESIKVQSNPDTPASKKADAKAGFNPTPGFECPSCHAPASRDKSFCPTCGGALKSTTGDDIIDVEPKA